MMDPLGRAGLISRVAFFLLTVTVGAPLSYAFALGCLQQMHGEFFEPGLFGFWLGTGLGPWFLYIGFRVLLGRPMKSGGLFPPFMLVGFGLAAICASVGLLLIQAANLLGATGLAVYSVHCFRLAWKRSGAADDS